MLTNEPLMFLLFQIWFNVYLHSNLYLSSRDTRDASAYRRDRPSCRIYSHLNEQDCSSFLHCVDSLQVNKQDLRNIFARIICFVSTLHM